MLRIFTVFFFVFVLSGCASEPYRTELLVEGLAPRPVEAECAVFDIVLPDCPYFVVGRIYMTSTSPKSELEYNSALNGLFEYSVSQAKLLGGDGVIQLMTGEAGTDFREGMGEFVAATIIKFEDPDCAHAITATSR